MSVRSKKLESEIEVTFSVTCHFCGVTHAFNKDESGESVEEAAKEIVKMGWNVVTSRKYQVTGAVRCPDCKGTT